MSKRQEKEPVSMTPFQVKLVMSSWEKVVPIADKAADIFYGKLFDMDPSLKPMFPADLTEQKKKLMTTLNHVVTSLENLPALVPAVQALGKKHVGYGVKPEHYGTVGSALLSTLDAGLGPSFTPEVKDAWTAAYGTLSSVMIEAGK
jgi:hemoglobin-like flavoprotein